MQNGKSREISKLRLKDVDVRKTALGRVELPNFDELMRLASENPEQLESIRKNAIETVINGAPKHMRERLQGLQFQIDMERKRCNNPVQACMKISSMMNDSIAELRYALNQPDDYLKSRTKHEAKVLSFTSPSRTK
ncbi:hypothetical protein A3715_00620 [Oleiphilus sp. HI0009]|nr:DUF3135 domain-containing protein [Oleiphilus sp. HI0125]KZX73901.1 hypothetical protein A3715_15635 [Oleiphilus sp. HI0009]MCH2157225.1 DUF3135 domain-containing protein [Oleiphilaceae bacterium]KZX82289.1 hypothetical protein A3715_00620 [Oleiphilus sp. HI0009]KZZ57657.1 hypothetical protein A3762_09445 [Oleiphilus sp. HI0125]KZZ61904.1 hypothetical protein A3762_24045 [Oleiphilus sp. HI0125]